MAKRTCPAALLHFMDEAFEHFLVAYRKCPETLCLLSSVTLNSRCIRCGCAIRNKSAIASTGPSRNTASLQHSDLHSTACKPECCCSTCNACPYYCDLSFKCAFNRL